MRKFLIEGLSWIDPAKFWWISMPAQPVLVFSPFLDIIDPRHPSGKRHELVGFWSSPYAWSKEAGLVLGQFKTKEKSNEITAIPKLLNCWTFGATAHRNCGAELLVDTQRKPGVERTCRPRRSHQKQRVSRLANLALRHGKTKSPLSKDGCWRAMRVLSCDQSSG